ncbi:MAG TPA: trypsin-like peptidase domain-containing protein, partial [Gemmataceae bacterium]|nr:trypsin-like peptidase domain-containing protein [Gemmataceae bacterium]
MKRYSLAATCLVLGGLLGSYFVAPALHGQQKDAAPVVAREFTSYREIVKRVLPAVVSLDIKVKAAPIQDPAKDNRVTFGSGVIVDTRGVVLTSYHVVAAAESVEVTLSDGRKLTTKDIRGDKKTDVAIIILDPKAGPFPHLTLGNSDETEIGDHVLAVGAPFGLAGSVTHGIIS